MHPPKIFFDRISDRRRYAEIAAVIITGFGKFVFVDTFHIKFWYILVSISGWMIYIISRTSKVSGLLRYWGFTFVGFKKVFLLILPFALILITSFVIYGRLRGTFVLNWHILPVIIMYQLWGIVQQFLMVSLVAGNLRDLSNRSLNVPLIIVITSVLFCIVHFPSPDLMAATFVMAIFYSLLFLQFRNIIPLGLYHGWLGGLFYFFILGRDPWNEVLNF